MGTINWNWGCVKIYFGRDIGLNIGELSNHKNSRYGTTLIFNDNYVQWKVISSEHVYLFMYQAICGGEQFGSGKHLHHSQESCRTTKSHAMVQH